MGVLDALKPTFKELGLDSAKAQKLVEVFAKGEQARSAKQSAEWVAAIKADPQMGGEKLQATAKAANAGAKWAGGEKFLAVLESSGLGNHPDVVRAMAKIGGSLKEDTVAGGSAASTKGSMSAEEKFQRGLFNNSPKMTFG